MDRPPASTGACAVAKHDAEHCKGSVVSRPSAQDSHEDQQQDGRYGLTIAMAINVSAAELEDMATSAPATVARRNTRPTKRERRLTITDLPGRNQRGRFP